MSSTTVKPPYAKTQHFISCQQNLIHDHKDHTVQSSRRLPISGASLTRPLDRFFMAAAAPFQEDLVAFALHAIQ